MFWMTKKNIKIRALEIEVRRLESVNADLKSDLERVTNIASGLAARLEDVERNKDQIVSSIDLSSPLFQRFIKAGRNTLIKKAHPDHGGTREQMEEIEAAFKILKTVKFRHGETALEAAERMQREAMLRRMSAHQAQRPGYYGR